MAKITRKVQKIFGSTAGLDQIGVFGSLAAAAPAFTTDPEDIQSLSNYLEGWFAAVDGDFNPAIEDMNAICFLYGYQLSYLMQTGVPEWNLATTYYIGSLVNDGSGNLFASLVDTNLNHALSDTARWRQLTGPTSTQTKGNGVDYTVLSSDGMVRVAGTNTQTMPSAVTFPGFQCVIKKTDGSGTNTIAFTGGQTADGAATLTLTEQYSYYVLRSNGATYDIVGAG